MGRRHTYRFLKSALALSVVMMSFQEIKAQQEWGYSQYLFNLYDIHSAYAGNHHCGSFAARYRSQWIGMDGAPTTQLLSFHAPMMKEKLGIGMKILNEKIGARTQQSGKASLAYKLHFNEKILSFGLAAGMVRQGIDRSKLIAADQQDVQLQNISSATLTPVLDASLFFNTNSFYTGLELQRLNKTAYSFAPGALSRLYYNMNVSVGYMRKVQEENMVHFSALMKLSEGNVWQAEVNMIYLLRNKFWFGGGYRIFTGAQVMMCANITEHLRLGASYDITTNGLRTSSDGSAEVFLGYNLKNRSGKSVRYF